MESAAAAEEFLDVTALIERSRPHPRVGWFGYAAGLFLLIVLVSAYVTSRAPQLASTVDAISKLAFIAIMTGLAVLTSWTLRRQREELKRVEGLEELVQLRRWPEAAATAQDLLSRPTRTPQARVQGLLLLASVLARYGRFEQAIAVHDHLLQTVRFDDDTAHGIRLGRAMAMLREDHLVDADRAISELRRTAGERESAGLALVQLYRDVKTGHPAEAIEHFNGALPVFQKQLGHRTGDAYGLVAKAYDLLGRTEEAASAYEKATLLTPVAELNRRYPEVATLAEKYRPAAAPADLAMGVA
jgi:tetratricopeptide (TPR) repeat protein